MRQEVGTTYVCDACGKRESAMEVEVPSNRKGDVTVQLTRPEGWVRVEVRRRQGKRHGDACGPPCAGDYAQDAAEELTEGGE